MPEYTSKDIEDIKNAWTIMEEGLYDFEWYFDADTDELRGECADTSDQITIYRLRGMLTRGDGTVVCVCLKDLKDKEGATRTDVAHAFLEHATW